METPNYVKSLLLPHTSKPAGRKVWSIDLESVWLPFFTATNVMGDSQLAPDILGAPIRLAYDADGSVKFSKAGRPVTKVVKDLSDSIRLVRENFTAGLIAYTGIVARDRADDFKAEITRNIKAGEPIATKDVASLNKALQLRAERAVSEAEAIVKAGQPVKAQTPDNGNGQAKTPMPAKREAVKV